MSRGTQFRSFPFQELNNWLGAKHIKTTAYHPRAHGLVERFQKKLKKSLVVKENSTNWIDNLPLTLLSIRNIIKEGHSWKPAEIVFSAPLLLPGHFFWKWHILWNYNLTLYFIQELKNRCCNHKSHLLEIQPNTCTHQQICEYVFVWDDAVKTQLSTNYQGPYKVLHKSDKYFTIEKGNISDTVAIDILIPASIEKQNQPYTHIFLIYKKHTNLKSQLNLTIHQQFKQDCYI